MKKLITLFVIFTLSFSANAQSINDNLLLHYPCNGNADDFGSNGYNGTTNATLVSDQFGNPNSAYSFNGLNQYIGFPNVSLLKPDLPITVSMWVYFNDLDPLKSVFFNSCFAQDNYAGIVMNRSQSGFLSVTYGTGLGIGINQRRSKSGTTNLQVGEWHHVAVVIRGQTDIDLYLNCMNDNGQYTGTASAPIGYTSDPGGLGHRGDIQGVEYYFDGMLDDVKYWNRALTFGEVQTLCMTSVPINEVSEQYKPYTIYPNPVDEKIFISGNFENITSIKMFDMSGKLIIETNNLTSSIDVSGIPNGVYFVNIIENGNLIVHKVLINK
jgi:hypothetical protein